jgi:hypothetical protein
MRTIVAAAKDLNRKGGRIDEAAPHLVTHSDAPTPELLENLKPLIGDSVRHADIDSRGRDGYTPLMHTCISQMAVDIDIRIQSFLDYRARPDLAMKKVET